MMNKGFAPDFEYTFRFHKSKFEWIAAMLALVIEYEFEGHEVERMKLSLADNNGVQNDKDGSGLHYGKKGAMYLSITVDVPDSDKISIFIATSKKFQPQVEFINLLQCTYEGFHKFRTYQ
jgi:hypothetical protein